FLSAFLLANISYCENLTEREWEIYYDYKEAVQKVSEEEISAMGWAVEDVYDKYNLTTDEVGDILKRGKAQKLTDKQRKIYDEFTEKQKEIEEKYEPVYDKADAEIMSEYGINEDQLRDIAGNALYYAYDMVPEGDLTEEDKKGYAKNKEIFEKYRNKKDAVDVQKEAEIKNARKDLADKYKTRSIVVVDICEKGGR
ncbi:MAG: hypothetical protein ABID09_01905, partial [Candidatus Omnitrophota bacterium]